MWKIILTLCVAQFLNVILGTLKNVITIKGGKILAAIMTALAYAFNTVVIKMVAGVDLYISVIITVVCNLVGVYIALLITEKIRKDQLWKITVTVSTGNFEALTTDLKANGITYISYETTWDKYKVLDVFSNDKKESKIISSLFNKYAAKYTISANVGTL